MCRQQRRRLYGFSERLKEAFLASGMTKIEFANKIGRERKMTYEYLNGSTPPRYIYASKNLCSSKCKCRLAFIW